MADENHTQMLIQPQPPPPQQQQQMQQQQLQQAQMQPQLQQQQMQQAQLPQQQLQQSAMQQQPPQQTVAATMPMGNSVEQNNHMNVTTSLPINVATINVSQPQMQTLQQTVNTSAGGSVQMAVPQLTAQAQTVQAGSMMSQSSAPHTTMIHPTMTMAQSPLQQVQVMQQPLSASYLQHLYPQQQLLFPGNLTLQHTGMTGPTLQSIGATQGLSLQLQAKTTLDPKTSIGGQTLQAVNANKAMAVNTGTMMTTSGQVIGAATQKANFPQQMITIPGKQTITHSQAGFSPATQNQTVVIGQLGVIPNQQSIFNQKAMTDSQKGKTFTFHNQQATLQPKSLYSSTLPVHSTAQVFNGSHMKPIGTQSQILTSQAPATMLGNAQIFGVSPFPQGFSWSAGNLQLAQNQPIIIQRQQSTDMYIQSPSQSAMQIPVAAATAPIPPTTYAPTPLAPSKPKQVRFATQTVAVATQTIVTTAATMNSNTTPLRAQVRPKGRYSAASSPIAPSASAPRMATTQTQTNQSHSQHPPQLPPNAQQKSDAGNQTHTGQVKPVTPLESKSISTQSKSVGVETKQHLSPQPPLKSQAMIAPSTKAQNTVSPTISTSLPSVTTSCDVMTTTTSTVSSTVTPTNTVLPSMPIITTYAAVAPTPSPITSVAVADSMTVTPKMNASVLSEEMEEDVDDPPECNPVEMAECEPLKPQPMLKPNLSPVKEKQPQKAIVKPQILTHVIDGFVIQEGPEPFPVSRSALLDSSYRVMPPEKLKKIEESPTAASPEKKRNTVHRPRGNVELAKCEFCGKMGPKYKFKRSKRFCSTSCAKRYNVCYSKRVGLLPSSNQENVAAGRKKKQGYKGRRGRKPSLTDQDLGISPVQMEVVPETTTEEPLLASIKVEEEVSEVSMDVTPQNVAPVEKAEEVDVVEVESSVMQKLPTKWTVQDVFEFIRDLPGCSDYADTFKSQEIDGQALLLLKEDHLMTAMSMKLGPALKLISQINSIKEELGQS